MTPYETEQIEATLAEIHREFIAHVVAFANVVAPVMAQAATSIAVAFAEFQRAVIAEHPEVADENGNLRDDWLDILRAKKQP